ncbi:uncharacterized protein LOC111354450 [Spodoptera litura]|uniref:Uncharacterized protein LOC111354450 n=1 Tax=Spodoptera litura TaxID=69820 RepID=A0A9J7E633_SPOLT|nr:uncharacterized protein LOC111354450 [Spodoptera litura]
MSLSIMFAIVWMAVYFVHCKINEYRRAARRSRRLAAVEARRRAGAIQLPPTPLQLHPRKAYELAPSTSSQPPRFELHLGAIPRVECSSAEPSQELIVPDQIHEVIVPSSQSSRHRPRRIRSAAGSDVRRRLFEYEDRREQRETARNQELAGIRAAMEEMCGIQRQILNYLAKLSEKP